MTLWKPHFTFILIISILVLITTQVESQTVTGTDFPFARFELRTPPQEAPFPGMGNYYSALSKGIETVMWNPASLTDIKYVQCSLSFISELKAYEYAYSYETEDGEETIGDQENFKVGYYFTGDETVTAAATREHTSHSLYHTQSTGIKFKQALRVNDWITFGILSHSDGGASIDLSGNFTAIAKTKADFYGSTDFMGSGLAIDNNGYLTFTHTEEGGATYQYTTSEKLWGGFLNQTSTVPLSVILESRNDISVDPGITLCGALKWRDLSFGASFTPISATCNVNNTARGVVHEGTSDIFIYQPDFDADDENAALNWVQNPNQYGSEAGYKINTINVPAGETVAEARAKGFYQASTMRTDLGLSYDLGDILTIGLVLENIGGAALNFKGQGRVIYVNSRISTAEPSGFDDPSQEFHWNLFKDEFEPVEDTEDLFLEEEINAELPKKIRVGLALKKPFLIAIDYEQNQTPFKFKQIEDDQEKMITVSNLRLLRIGIESQFLALPMWMRFGMPLMLKPEVEGLDPDAKENFDNAFKFGVIPVGFDMGTEINFWGTYVGNNIGFNLSSVLALYQLDALNLDMGKIGYWDVFVRKEPWKVTYLAAIDPASTAGAYANREDKDQDFGMEHLRWIQTFTVSYKF